MKKIFLTLALHASLFISVIAQHGVELKPFKVNVSLGYAIPEGSGTKAGVLFAIEPKYAVMSNLSVGIRTEGAIMARFSGGYDAYGNPIHSTVRLSGSYLAAVDYYFTDNYNIRPFGGAGAGLFVLARAESSSNNSGNVSEVSKFGEVIRFGLEMAHFRICAEYNIVPKTTFNGWDENGAPVTGLISKNNYIGIKFGACFGGGRR